MKRGAIAILMAAAALSTACRGQTMTTNEAAKTATGKTEYAMFGAGCFWCSEAVFERLDGVKSVTPGYAGGHTKNPTYEQVCAGDTGHAEVARIEFDPAKVPYERLLDLFWEMHDPTTPNRQGADVGAQYRSVVFYYSDAQKKAAELARKKLDDSKKHSAPVVTEILAAPEFYPAENYHQDYFNRNTNAPYCRYVIAPKLKKLGMGK